MTKQTSQFGCGYLQTAQEVTESVLLNHNHSRTSFAALSTQRVSFSRHLCSRRDARVDKPMPKERFLEKVTSKIQIYRAGLKPMQLHWAPRHGGWTGRSFLPDAPYARELQKGF